MSDIARPGPDDAINLYKGFGYVVKDGKMTSSYHRTESDAVNAALKIGAKAFKIVRDQSRTHSTAIALVEVQAFDSKFETPAESIAENVRETLNVPKTSFISPVMKPRAIIILKDICQDLKALAFEAYEILFPYSNKSQFDRIWNEIADMSDVVEDLSDNNQMPNSLAEFAKSRNLSEAVAPILANNVNGLISFIETSSAKLSNIIALIDHARKVSSITTESAKSLSDAAENFCSIRQVEEQHGSALKMIKQYPAIRRMVISRNVDGIAEFLSTRLMDKRDAASFAEEMVKLSSIIKKNLV